MCQEGNLGSGMVDVFGQSAEWPVMVQLDFMPVYSGHLREIIKKGIDHPDNFERPLEGFKIIVDAGNGSGGFLASDVLAPLGADTTGVRHRLRVLSESEQSREMAQGVHWSLFQRTVVDKQGSTPCARLHPYT